MALTKDVLSRVITFANGKGGVGKFLTLETRIPTPTGWTTMGEVRAGTAVLGRDGLPTIVEATYDHDDLDLFDVHLSDGQVIRACGDHNWLVASYYERLNRSHPKRRRAARAWDEAHARAQRVEVAAGRFDGDHTSTLEEIAVMVNTAAGETMWNNFSMPWTAMKWGGCSPVDGTRSLCFPTAIALKTVAEYLRSCGWAARDRPTPGLVREKVLTTKEMLASVKVFPGGRETSNYAIRLTRPLDLPEAALPVEPYVLGAWLGYGAASGGGFTGIDPEIWQQVEAAGYEITHSETERKAHCIKCLVPGLREAGVLNSKHIPLAYQRASLDQRLAMLQGLMDTDGGIGADGGCELSLCDETLARDAPRSDPWPWDQGHAQER